MLKGTKPSEKTEQQTYTSGAGKHQTYNIEYDNGFEENMASNDDEVVDALRDVEQAVSRVESATNQVQKAIDDKWPIVQYATGLVVFLLAWAFIKDAWYSKWRLSVAYDVSTDKINVDKPSHDCNFFAAPIGEKYCHYDREVTTLRWATSANGQPILSYDEGKTWVVFAPDPGVTVPKTPTVQQVYVSWKKVDE